MRWRVEPLRADKQKVGPTRKNPNIIHWGEPKKISERVVSTPLELNIALKRNAIKIGIVEIIPQFFRTLDATGILIFFFVYIGQKYEISITKPF